MVSKFSQSKKSRNLSNVLLDSLSEDDAHRMLIQIRFAWNRGEPVCPHCSGHSLRFARRYWRFHCRRCLGTFSVTSGTIWSGTKIEYRKLVKLAARFIQNTKGNPSIELARQLDLAPSTVWLALHRLRQAMESDADGVMLSGVCEADGCYVGGWVREHVYEKFRRRRDLRKERNKKSLCVVRERKGRVLIQVNKDEPSFEPFIRERVQPGSEVHTDMANTWEKLGDTFAVRSINHSKHYWTETASTNSAEAFFRRVRRMEKEHVHISGRYLDLYGWEAAFRDTHCRMSDAEKFVRLLSLCLRQKTSRRFKGYYQRRRLE